MNDEYDSLIYPGEAMTRFFAVVGLAGAAIGLLGRLALAIVG